MFIVLLLSHLCLMLCSNVFTLILIKKKKLHKHTFLLYSMNSILRYYNVLKIVDTTHT